MILLFTSLVARDSIYALRKSKPNIEFLLASAPCESIQPNLRGNLGTAVNKTITKCPYLSFSLLGMCLYMFEPIETNM